jgi:hypothetical protein
MTRYLRAASLCLVVLPAYLLAGGCGGEADTSGLASSRERSQEFSIYSSLSCSFSVRDAHGRAVPGQTVALEFSGNMCPNTPFVYGTTDSNGNASLYRSALTYDCYGNQVAISSYRCVVYPNTADYPDSYSYLTSTATATTSTATSMSLATILTPKRDWKAFTPGLANNSGVCSETNDQCSKLDFYRGADSTYDKVVVIAEPTLTERNNRRSAGRMWREYNADPSLLGGSGILQQLYAKGYDVWIVRTNTMQDVWEQAAEFAQAVQYAVSGSHPFGRPTGDGKVITFGHSLGGLKARMAITRWDHDSNDAAGGGAGWRNALSAALGLAMDYPVPVNLIVSGDAPHRGAQLSTDLQWVLSRDAKPEYIDGGLTECSERQMLQVISRYGEDNSTLGWNTFYKTGGAFTFAPNDSPGIYGVVERRTCYGGPPVMTQGRNGNGWPSGIKKIAWSQGKPGETQRCYGDSRDYNVNGLSLCPGTSGPWTPTDGSTFLYINKYSVDFGNMFDGWITIDRNLVYHRERPFAFNDDLESGGKHNILRNETTARYIFRLKGYGVLTQYGPVSTFIPLRSALDRDCDPTVGSCPKVMDAEWANSYNAAHTRIEKPVVDWLLQQLDNVQNGAPLSDGGSMVGLGSGSSGASWTYCANEDGTCSFSGTRTVRYGANGTYVTRNATGSIACSNATFGDPLFGVAKHCDYASSVVCAEASCTSLNGVYISHFTGPACTGTESYYTPYFNTDGKRRSWDGNGLAGTTLRTVTNRSYKNSAGTCYDAWPSGNTLSGFVTIYR